MASVTAFEAKTRFGTLLERVTRGEEIVITRHDKPVARIVPERGASREAVRVAAAGLRGLRQRIAKRRGGKPPLTHAQIVRLIQEGRR
jgi:prevent-host-death family protein